MIMITCTNKLIVLLIQLTYFYGSLTTCFAQGNSSNQRQLKSVIPKLDVIPNLICDVIKIVVWIQNLNQFDS